MDLILNGELRLGTKQHRTGSMQIRVKPRVVVAKNMRTTAVEAATRNKNH